MPDFQMKIWFFPLVLHYRHNQQRLVFIRICGKIVYDTSDGASHSLPVGKKISMSGIKVYGSKGSNKVSFSATSAGCAISKTDILFLQPKYLVDWNVSWSDDWPLTCSRLASIPFETKNDFNASGALSQIKMTHLSDFSRAEESCNVDTFVRFLNAYATILSMRNGILTIHNRNIRRKTKIGCWMVSCDQTIANSKSRAKPSFGCSLRAIASTIMTGTATSIPKCCQPKP